MREQNVKKLSVKDIKFLEKVKKYCEQYDYMYDHYPESEWEGASVFEYIENCILKKVK